MRIINYKIGVICVFGLIFVLKWVMVSRKLFQPILKQCFQSKLILLIGARQVGKTHLMRQLQSEIQQPGLWLNADEADIKKALTDAGTSTQLKALIGKYKLVFIDEAQQIDQIGLKLKLIHDNFPDIQLIVSGSSAFELQHKISEPLTGRKRIFHLFPFSFEELKDYHSELEERRYLNTRLIYGSYPEVVLNAGFERAVLNEIAGSYLYKDLLQIDGIRKSALLEKLLQALAFQIGNEVSFHELSRTIGNINAATVEKYIDMLEKTFVIFKLSSLSRNFRNELKKGKKYYFYDLGIRNMLINNFQPIGLRQDTGSLWENYCIAERLKFNAYSMNASQNCYFWRTRDQAEIDYLEEMDGWIHAYEMKYAKDKANFPKSFIQYYPNHTTRIINQENYSTFIS